MSSTMEKGSPNTKRSHSISSTAAWSEICTQNWLSGTNDKTKEFFFCQTMELHTGSVVFVLSLLFLIHSHELQIEWPGLSTTGRWCHRIWLHQDHQEGISGHLNNTRIAIWVRLKALPAQYPPPNTVPKQNGVWEGCENLLCQTATFVFQGLATPHKVSKYLVTSVDFSPMSLYSPKPTTMSIPLAKEIASPCRPYFMVSYRSFVFY